MPIAPRRCCACQETTYFPCSTDPLTGRRSRHDVWCQACHDAALQRHQREFWAQPSAIGVPREYRRPPSKVKAKRQ